MVELRTISEEASADEIITRKWLRQCVVIAVVTLSVSKGEIELVVQDILSGFYYTVTAWKHAGLGLYRGGVVVTRPFIPKTPPKVDDIVYYLGYRMLPTYGVAEYWVSKEEYEFACRIANVDLPVESLCVAS